MERLIVTSLEIIVVLLEWAWQWSITEVGNGYLKEADIVQTQYLFPELLQ